MRELFRCFPRRSHPMPVLSAAVMALSTFDSGSVGGSPREVERATERLMGKMPTLAAYSYKNSMGQPTLFSGVSGYRGTPVLVG